MNNSTHNANGGLLSHVSPPLPPQSRSAPAASLPGSSLPVLAGPPLTDDRLEWTPDDLAACLDCQAQKITYHCRQLERRGRLHKTAGVWRFDYATARLLLKHVVDNGHRRARGEGEEDAGVRG